MKIVKNTLNLVFENKYSSTILTIILVCYAYLTRPTLPKVIVMLFENPIFRIFILSLIVYRGNKDPRFSLIVATGFTIIMDIISKKKIFDTFANVDDTADDDMGDAADDDMGDAAGDDMGDAVDDNMDNTMDDSNTPDMDTPAVDNNYIDANNDPDYTDGTTDKSGNEGGDYDPYEEKNDDEENVKYIDEEDEKCRELPDGTDTCSDDKICDKGKCIDAT